MAKKRELHCVSKGSANMGMGNITPEDLALPF